MADDPNSQVSRYGATIPPDNDYGSWEWRALEAAIVGGADMSNTRKHDLRVDWSVPTSLTTAAQTFFDLADRMTSALATFNYNVNALVGDGTNGPWKGDAAKVASDNFKFFSSAVQQQVDAINGNGDPTKAIYNQLWDSGNYLNWAINEINSIDAYYAEEAKRVKPDVTITTASDGTQLVHVSEVPGLPELIAKTMAPVLKSLADKYYITHKDKQIPPYNPPVLPRQQPPMPNIPPPPPLDLSKLGPPPGGGGPNTNLAPPPPLDLSKLGGPPGLGNPPPLSGKNLGLPNALNPAAGPGGAHAFTGLTNPPSGPAGLGTPSGRLPPAFTGPGSPGTGPAGPHGPGGIVPIGVGGIPPGSFLSAPGQLRSTNLPTGLFGPGGPGGGLDAFGNPIRGNRLTGLDAFGHPISGGGFDAFGRPLGRGNPASLAGEGNAAALGGRAGALSADEAALAGRGGMPYPPPMGGAGGAGRPGEQDRERTTWLEEDEEVWGADPDLGPAVLGRC